MNQWIEINIPWDRCITSEDLVSIENIVDKDERIIAIDKYLEEHPMRLLSVSLWEQLESFVIEYDKEKTTYSYIDVIEDDESFSKHEEFMKILKLYRDYNTEYELLEEHDKRQNIYKEIKNKWEESIPKTFVKLGLNKPGTLVVVKGKEILLGSCSFCEAIESSCDCCTSYLIKDADIVEKYKIIWQAS